MPRSLQMTLVGVRLIGLPNALRSIVYALRRDWLDARHAPRPGHALWQPGRLVAAEPAPGGAQFRFEFTSLAVRFLEPGLILLAWDGAAMLPSYAVARTDWPPAQTTLEQTADGWRLSSPLAELRLSTDGAVEIWDAAGRRLRR
jgi:alpha-glucosidase